MNGIMPCYLALVSSPLGHLGFLHYGNHDVDPFTALRTSIGELPEGIADILLVLPEAFNTGTNDEYYHAPIRSGSEVFDRLLGIGNKRNISFVAGLAISDSSDLPYSSAFLITRGQRPVLLSHKRSVDGALKTYRPYQGEDFEAVVRFQNIALGALVCMDSYQDSAAAHLHGRLQKSFEQVTDVDAKLLCVPERTTGWSRGVARTPTHHVPANGHWECLSFLDDSQDNDILAVPRHQLKENLIQTVPVGRL